MRVVHVVTLVSDDGAFGGPLRVALNQVRELRRRGHAVTLAAGWRGVGSPPVEVDGVPVRLFPVRQAVPGSGFSGLISTGLLRWLRTALPEADLAHVHSGRDLISLGALGLARASGTRYVVQTHGMIAPDPRPRARVLDALLVRRLLGSAARHLVLTSHEMRDLQAMLPGRVRLHRVLNGVPVPREAAQLSREVLYCARLHPRKRPEAFVEMAGLLRDRGLWVDCPVVGPDEGSLALVQARVRELGLQEQVRYEGALPYDGVLERMRRAGIYVLPSVDEPFPMSLLEALSLGLPCVTTDSCGISDLLQEAQAAVITDGSPEALADAVAQLLGDEPRRQALATRARQTVRERFSIDAVVDDLEAVYAEVLRAGLET